MKKKESKLHNEDVLNVLKDIREELRNANINNEYEDWITHAELLQKLGCSKRTLNDYKRKGLIPFSKLGGSYFYSKKAINEVLQQKFNKTIN